MSVEEVDAAETWPDAGIGLMPGKLSGVIALDWDYDGGVKEMLEGITPPSIVRKVGSKGYTAFYRYNGEVTRRWTVGDERVLECLSCGTQTVMPGSIHPATGAPYYWETADTLLDCDLEELAQLPLDYFDKVDALLTPYKATVTGGSGQSTGSEIEAEKLSDDEIRRICDALNHIPADDRDVWIRVGMALKGIGDDPGFNIWHNWSSRSSKFDEAARLSMRSKWRGFRILERGVSYRSIFKMAIEAGYTPEPEPPTIGVIKPGVVGDMARAAMDHAIRNGLIEAPEDYVETAPHVQKRPVKTGLRILEGKAEIGDLRPPDWLIKGVLTSDSLAMLYGAAGAGKTFACLDMALHIAAGKPYHDRPVKQCPVVYIAGEGRAGIAKRVLAWCDKWGVDLDEIPFGITSRSVAFLDDLAVNELAEVLHNRPQNAGLVIVDTVARNFGDGDENSTRDMSKFVDSLDVIRTVNDGACVLVVHHTGKAEGAAARGNSALRAAIDTEIAVKGVEGGVTVTCTKQKDAEQFDSIPFKFETIKLAEIEGEVVDSLVCVPDETAAKQKEATAKMLENGGKGLNPTRQATAEKIKTICKAYRHNRPDLGRAVITRVALQSELEGIGQAERTAQRSIVWATEAGLLIALGGHSFEVSAEGEGRVE